MRNLINLKTLLIGSIFLLGLSGSVLAADGSIPGIGDPNDPYLIEDLADFDVFADPNNAAIYWARGIHTKLMCDPNLFGRTYTTAVIAPDIDNTNDAFDGISFEGIFDGNGHIISNLTIDSNGIANDYLGLFGHLYYGAEIKDLGLEDVSITGGDGVWSLKRSMCIGGLCGENSSGTISNCYTTGSVTGGDFSIYLGGLVGNNDHGNISDCDSTIYVSGGFYSEELGGLCGTNINASIRNCYAIGSVAGGDSSDRLGGLCGSNSGPISNCYATSSVNGVGNSMYLGGLCGYNSGTIINCYATGSVSGDRELGGLCGYNSYSGTISNCYATGSVSGNFDLGGLCGDNGYSGTISNSFWDIETGGPDNGLGTPKTTSEMQTQSTFTDAGWDFVSETGNGTSEVWQIAFGRYPLLSNLSGYVPLELTGDGTLENPYLISEANELGAIYHYQSNAYYQLTDDIDLTGIIWSIAPIPFFNGIFDGNGFVIDNLVIEGVNLLGLFGYLESSAEIKDIGLNDVSITGRYSLGGLCGSGGNISNCYSTGSVSGGAYLGGLCGSGVNISNCYSTSSVSGGGGLGGLCGSGGNISNCYSTGSVSGGTGSGSLGGLCGYGSNISNCYSTGSVSGGNDSYHLGGLCGNGGGTISNCYSTGSVTGGDDSYGLGGLCGRNTGSVSSCYTTGSVTGGDFSIYQGGLCGMNQYGSYNACFWNVTVDPNLADCGYDYSTSSNDVNLPEVFAETTENMQMLSTFTDAGWDFVGETDNGTHEIWQILPDSYPTLYYQNNYVPLVLTGDGTEENPYLISDPNELGAIYHYDRSCHYRLTGDIDLSGISWSTAPIPLFSGRFVGGGYVIDNLTIDSILNYLGLFSQVGSGGELINLGLENVAIAGGDYSSLLGGLCGYSGGTISNCYLTGSVSGGDYLGGLCGSNGGSISNCYSTGSVSNGEDSDHLGGLCGYNSGPISNCYSTSSITGGADSKYLGGLCGRNSGSISDCYITGSVTGGNGSDKIGGLCGFNNYGNISNCYSTGPVRGGVGGSWYLGGLCGDNRYSSISNCYSTGSVRGERYLGGLCGFSVESSISDCYSTGFVTGNNTLGGLSGYNSDSSYTACFWDITVNPALSDCGYDSATNSYNVDLPEVFAETTETMQDPNTFISAGWDFVNETDNGTDNYWRLCIDGVSYPQLAWQSQIGDIGCPDGVDLVDFAYLAYRWLDINCETSNDCGGADLDFSTDVGLGDLLIFAQHWLKGTSP